MLTDWLPLNLETKISVLITSNAIWTSRDYGEVKHIPVEKFTTAEFSEFVKKIIPNVSEADIKILDEYTGRFPYLANIVCFGLAEWAKHCTYGNITEYFELTEESGLFGDTDFMIYERSPKEIVGRQIKLMQKYYKKHGAVAYKLLCILAYCNPEVPKWEIKNITRHHKALQIIMGSNNCKIVSQVVKMGIQILTHVTPTREIHAFYT